MRKAWPLLLAVVAGAATAAVPPRPDPASRISQHDSASEYWDLMARFESGHRLVWRFLITNEGPGERTATAVGRLVNPDGTITRFRNARRQGSWTLDEEGLELRIGSSFLDLRGPIRSFAVDSTKQGVKIDLRVHARDPGAPGAGPADYRVDLLDLSAPIEGSVWVRGMEDPLTLRGRAALTHTWMEESEPDLARRRFDFASLQGDTAVVLYDLSTPAGTRSRRLVIAQRGKIIYESNDFELSLGGSAAGWDDAAYPLPETLHFRNEDVEGRIRLARVLLEHEPLKDLPQPFRFLLSLKMRPRRVWADSPFELNLNAGPGRASLQVRGTGMTSVTYLNPLGSQASNPPNTSSGA